MDNGYAISRMRALQTDLKFHLQWEAECKLHKEEGVPYWEHIIRGSTLLNNGLCIYPRVNMISNVGLDKNSTHAPEDLENLPQSVQQYFHTMTYDLEFPLQEPDYMIDDRIFVESYS